VEAQLHAFLTAALDGSSQLHILAALAPGKEPPIPTGCKAG